MQKLLQVKVALQIQKSAAEVFEAIVNPEKMKNYFISESTGPMKEGKVLVWKFPEFEEEAPVRIDKIEQDKYISFYWDIDEEELLTEIELRPAGNNSTVVHITEKSRQNDEMGIQWLQNNTEGWANFLACLKAYLEYGINLREGGFDFLQK
ncbi:MAG: SRPBCC domain-containing protein [Salegentibacter sp.]|uniref:SRPBCC domain-containing protein n=1 Tax=Salegentibacter sp. TaxID=1903072 RepID=UPI00287009AC|nr:SRPBCC domain-containing protein [Salegentibacter sp.]MDR9457125.1 SRPBCC domain-containing protein [Salegentibacter sp.]